MTETVFTRNVGRFVCETFRNEAGKKEQEKKKKVYTLTNEQIDDIKDQAVREALKIASEKVAEESFILMLTLPLEVLITEEYWMKSAKKRIPKFIAEVLRLYKGYEEGSITIEEMEEDLWEFAGIKIDRKKY